MRVGVRRQVRKKKKRDTHCVSRLTFKVEGNCISFNNPLARQYSNDLDIALAYSDCWTTWIRTKTKRTKTSCAAITP